MGQRPGAEAQRNAAGAFIELRHLRVGQVDNKVAYQSWRDAIKATQASSAGASRAKP